MKTILALLFLISSSASADRCLSYHGTTTIRGILSKHTFPEQPNYESIAKGDAAATYFFVTPHKPFCVAPGDLANDEMGENHIPTVQLAFSLDNLGYKSLRPLLGRTVVCQGNFYHAMSGHHHSLVLLGTASCHAG